ncbi:unnamed protein product [Amoebophrya sp. A120]|nr:unnamed protein product [Amoebophrya sp. A120]|eukprot:GSA120T00019445001.1
MTAAVTRISPPSSRTSCPRKVLSTYATRAQRQFLSSTALNQASARRPSLAWNFCYRREVGAPASPQRGNNGVDLQEPPYLLVRLHHDPDFLSASWFSSWHDGANSAVEGPATASSNDLASSSTSVPQWRAGQLDQILEFSRSNKKTATHNFYLVTSANEALLGTAFPYFPRGGFRNKAGQQEWPKDWQKSSHWCGMESGNGMVYPEQAVDGLVHRTFGSAGLEKELERAREFLTVERERIESDLELEREKEQEKKDREQEAGISSGITSSGVRTSAADVDPSSQSRSTFIKATTLYLNAVTRMMSFLLSASNLTVPAERNRGKSGGKPGGSTRVNGKNTAAGLESEAAQFRLCPPGNFVVTDMGRHEMTEQVGESQTPTSPFSKLVHAVAPYYDGKRASHDSAHKLSEPKINDNGAAASWETTLKLCYSNMIRKILFRDVFFELPRSSTENFRPEMQQSSLSDQALELSIDRWNDKHLLNKGKAGAQNTASAENIKVRPLIALFTPLLGTGVKAVPVKEGARLAAEAIAEFQPPKYVFTAICDESGTVDGSTSESGSTRSTETLLLRELNFVTNDAEKFDVCASAFREVFQEKEKNFLEDNNDGAATFATETKISIVEGKA